MPKEIPWPRTTSKSAKPATTLSAAVSPWIPSLRFPRWQFARGHSRILSDPHLGTSPRLPCFLSSQPCGNRRLPRQRRTRSGKDARNLPRGESVAVPQAGTSQTRTQRSKAEMKIRFLADVNLSAAIVEAVLRLEASIDFQTQRIAGLDRKTGGMAQ